MTDEEFYNKSLEERSNYVLDAMKGISFYKKDDIWYADVPEHSESENEMVAGADVFLEKLSNGKPYISLKVSDKIYPKARFVFQRIDHDNGGATYLILGHHPEAPALSGESQDYAGQKFWLCNVVHTFFGEHPKYISVI